MIVDGGKIRGCLRALWVVVVGGLGRRERWVTMAGVKVFAVYCYESLSWSSLVSVQLQVQ